MATKIDISSPATESILPSKNSSCPWGKKKETPVCSFMSVMDEEYAKQLEGTEISEDALQDSSSIPVAKVVDEDTSQNTSDGSDDTANDLLLAQMLQLEYNRENDQYVKSLENHYNGTSKVSMSFKNFKVVHRYEKNEGNIEEYDEENEEEDFDEDDQEIEERKSRGDFITKHDQVVNERKNAKNVEQFPLHFNSGDVGRKDIRLPNHVYNKLKTHSKKEERSGMRIHEKQEHATHEKALDENTRLIMYKMVNNGILDSISGIVSTGKEAVVLHAKGGESNEIRLPAECAIKVFKTTLNEFKTREKYIKDDHRFRDRFSKQNPRKIVRLWAEKEFRNLNRMKSANICCPEVLCLRKHILLMTFVGKNQKPAPKLKDAILSRSELESAYEQCIQTMKTMFEKCNLIHSDLSEYNILWHENKCCFIDVSQSVEPIHENAFHFLHRDCRNIVSFFKKAGLADMVMKEDELFSFVCGKELKSVNLDVIEKEYKSEFERDEEMLVHGIDSENYAFDYHFARSQLENLSLKKEEEESSEDDNESKSENEDEILTESKTITSNSLKN